MWPWASYLTSLNLGFCTVLLWSLGLKRWYMRSLTQCLAHCRHSTSILQQVLYRALETSKHWPGSTKYMTTRKDHWAFSADHIYPKSSQRWLGSLMSLPYGKRGRVYRKHFYLWVYNPDVFPVVIFAVHQNGCSCLSDSAEMRGCNRSCFKRAWKGERRLPTHRLSKSNTMQPSVVM